MMYSCTLFMLLLAQASAWQLASPVSSRSVVRRSRSPVAVDGLMDAHTVESAQQVFLLVAEKVDSGKAFEEISKTAGPVFDSAVKTAGPILESAGKEAGKAIEAAIPELRNSMVIVSPPWQCPSSAPAPPQGAPVGPVQLCTPGVGPSHCAPSRLQSHAFRRVCPFRQKGFEASKPVLQQTANDLAPVAKQAADIVAPVLQQALVTAGQAAASAATELGKQAAAFC